MCLRAANPLIAGDVKEHIDASASSQRGMLKDTVIPVWDVEGDSDTSSQRGC